MTELTIPRTLATELLTHAQSRPDERVCGLVRGSIGAPRLQRLANQAADPRAQVALPAIDGNDLLAVYWSHPHGAPLPEPEELAGLDVAAPYLLVISLDTKGVLEMRAFAGGGSDWREVPVHIFMA